MAPSERSRARARSSQPPHFASRPITPRLMFSPTRHVEEEAKRLAVLGEIDDAGGDRLARLGEPDLAAVEPDRPGAARRRTVDQAREFGASGADQAGKAEHLAGMENEAGPPHAAAVGQITELEHRAPGGAAVMLLLVEGGEIAPDHHAHDRLGLDFVAAERADIAAVAQHGDAVGELVHLGHAMRDVDDGESLGAQPRDQVEQPARLAIGERGGRLVHHQDARPRMHRARDLDHLLLGDRQIADQRARPEAGAEAREHLRAAADHGGAVDRQSATRLAAEMDVLGNREVGRERELLIDDRDAMRLGRERAVDLRRLAVEPDLRARIRRIGAGEDLHQRRLAGAVLPHQRVHLARMDGELEPG